MSTPPALKDFYVVGIGASAGGLDALEKFFSNAPSDGGMAYVVIQHLSPDYKSLMADLLSKRTDMPVLVAEDGMPVEPNHVYLIPPKQSITIFHRKLFLTEREQGQLYLPIDIFFQSLAQDLEEKAVGVILSGTGSDGARGLRAIKEKGGLAIVQDERSAKFDGMPRSALATNLVDYVLLPEQMAREIMNYAQHPCLASDSTVRRNISADDDSLNKIFALLRANSGVDFTYYKQSTMMRRIERRMGVKQVETLPEYLHLLYQNPTEANTLYREFLIGVTHFFRDPEAFDLLQKEVIPAIFQNKRRGDTIRVWAPGCSTGEEAYSLAILMNEYMETTGRHMDVKVFATDLDRNALEFAGRGTYPESIAEDVSAERLQNYFVKNGDSYVVARRVREMVIFAQQNIITDPPFSKVDLISCRNLLIYLQPVLQKKVIAAFQFALNPDGYLFLGSSETIGDSGDFFQSVSARWKIYQYKGGFRPKLDETRLLNSSAPYIQAQTGRRISAATGREDWRVIDGIQRGLLEAFLPATVVVDENMDVVYIAGNADAFLRLPVGGLFTSNILKQAREGLAVPISTALHKALKDGQEVFYKNIPLEGKEAGGLDLKAKPFIEPSSRQKMAFVQFVPSSHSPGDSLEAAQTFDVNAGAQQRIQDLEHELQYTRESLQATVEELETSNEELQATNEELFAANEELQSTNEELHSVNEELITVNAEYHAKIQELTKVNEDINNLLDNTNIGVVFLDRDLRIRLFTPGAQKAVHLASQDVGRPIHHIAHDLIDCDLTKEAQRVQMAQIEREMETRDSNGRWYHLKFSPYYTLNRQAVGVVVALIDVTEYKNAVQALRESESRYRALVSNLPDSAVLLFDREHRYLVAGGGEIEKLGLKKEQIEGRALKEVFPPELAKMFAPLYQKALEGSSSALNYQHESKQYEVNVSPLRNEQGETYAGMVIARNITARAEMEEKMELSLQKYQAIFDLFPFGLTIADKHGKIFESNRKAEEILGVSKAQHTARSIDGAEWKIIRPDGSPMPPEEYASVRALKEKRLIENVEMGVVKGDEQVKWIRVAAAPFADQGVVVVYEEISPPRRKL